MAANSALPFVPADGPNRGPDRGGQPDQGFRQPVRAVADLSFTVEPGSVTGFLGPNGRARRRRCGCCSPSRADAAQPPSTASTTPPCPAVRTVGAVLKATTFHPARTGREHLRMYCGAAGLPVQRADEALHAVGLADAASSRTRGYSMGMRQRSRWPGAARRPAVLILDEPANGLEPEGIRWLRGFLRHLAREGRTVLVTSHQLAEVEQVRRPGGHPRPGQAGPRGHDRGAARARRRPHHRRGGGGPDSGTAAARRWPRPAGSGEHPRRPTGLLRVHTEGPGLSHRPPGLRRTGSSCTSCAPSGPTWRSCSSPLTEGELPRRGPRTARRTGDGTGPTGPQRPGRRARR